MNNERLLKLADLLEADAKKKKGIRFDMDSWGAPAEGSDLRFEPGQPVPVDCRTEACALGLAAISGEFKDAGLSYKVHGPGWLMPILINKPGYDPFDVGCYVFGIDRVQSSYLFDPEHYPDDFPKGAKGERLVAQRIREMVAAKGEMTQRDDQWD